MERLGLGAQPRPLKGSSPGSASASRIPNPSEGASWAAQAIACQAILRGRSPALSWKKHGRSRYRGRHLRVEREVCRSLGTLPFDVRYVTSLVESARPSRYACGRPARSAGAPGVSSRSHSAVTRCASNPSANSRRYTASYFSNRHRRSMKALSRHRPRPSIEHCKKSLTEAAVNETDLLGKISVDPPIYAMTPQNLVFLRGFQAAACCSWSIVTVRYWRIAVTAARPFSVSR